VAELRAMKAEQGLTNVTIATLAGVSLKTVESWLADPGAASHRAMAQRHLDLIRLMLPKRRPARRS
jgi:hypothetical protein